MTVELRPLNVSCNIQCHYCYQHPQRDAGAVHRAYDIEKMKSAITAEGGPFTVFGGEPLLVPLNDLEDLWSWGLQQFGKNGIQTNGILISDAHIELFRRYRVHVGISIDGPDELNDVRWHGNLATTRESTSKTIAAIRRLCAEGLPPSLIITLHRLNAVEPHLTRLTEWVGEMSAIGARDVILHLLESESDEIRRTYGLSTSENIAALTAFHDLEMRAPDLRLELFSGMRRLLTGDDRQTTCVWWACDPYTTRTVRGVEGNGQRTNCGRTNKDGIDFVKASAPGFERYIALYQTPQQYGGCQGCRFFLMCKGQCPGTAIDGDWRNRTEHCEVWKNVYEQLEAECLGNGIEPLSLRPERHDVERAVINEWMRGREATIADLIKTHFPHTR